MRLPMPFLLLLVIFITLVLLVLLFFFVLFVLLVLLVIFLLPSNIYHDVEIVLDFCCYIFFFV